jgi:hypothetical protein
LSLRDTDYGSVYIYAPDGGNINNLVTKFESFEHTDGEALNAFESSVGFALPADYREFLERHNGGKFKGALFDIPELHMSEALDVLFGFNTKRALDLRHWQNEMRGQIPNKSIIIGKDPGGNFLVLDEGGRLLL